MEVEATPSETSSAAVAPPEAPADTPMDVDAAPAAVKAEAPPPEVAMAQSSGFAEGAAIASGGDPPPRAPLKKAVSAFLHFCSEQREAVKAEKPGMNVGEVTKMLSEKWRALDDAGKQKYVDIAAADKARYEREKKDAPEPAPKKPAAPIDPYETVIPVARVKKICKLDPDVKSVSKEATAVISKATEIFVAQLARETHLAASGKKMIRARPTGEYAPKPVAKKLPVKAEANQPGISQFFAPVRKSPVPGDEPAAPDDGGDAAGVDAPMEP
ncbi:DNA binding protein [Aureococcus anophagefferens]|nr:DNA binding protein [Aureococcus anophagefferens]